MNLIYMIFISTLSIIAVASYAFNSGGAMFFIGLSCFLSIIIIITMNILLEFSNKRNSY